MPDSIKFGTYEDGRKSGMGMCLFEDEDSTLAALRDRQGQNIHSRYIELFQVPYAEWDHFNRTPAPASRKQYLDKYVTPANQDRVIKIRGLSFMATLDDVLDFFGDYDLSESDVILETKDNGKKTGFALVFMPTQESADEAI